MFHFSLHVGLALQTSVTCHQPAIPQQSVPLPITFTQEEPIDQAFTRLSASVTGLIQNVDFHSLQRACIEKTKSPKMLLKSNEILPVIKEAQSFQALCSTLADTTYWNFLDIRIMETMATASLIPAAQEAVDNFKKTFFNMTLKEAAPYFPVIKVKPNHTELHEELDRDPNQMTIGELHKHRFYLETEILNTGPDTCTICRIIIGSVGIVWQIHVDHAYLACCRLKTLHSQLSLHAIHFMSVPEMEKWEGLPFVWHGEDMGDIGPIKSSIHVQHEPYPLPQGFEWVIINSSNFGEVIQLYYEINPLNPISKNLLKWFISGPYHKKGCLLGIRLSSSKKLVWFVACTPYNIRVGGKLLSIVSLKQTIGPDAEKQQNQLYNAGIKETMRLLGSEGILQALIFTNHRVIPKPVISCDVYNWVSLLHPLPYVSTKTVGLRRMKKSDVPKAMALTNKYTSQFEIGQVFQSEKEFSHWFLSPLLNNVATYVVEESNSGNITDMFSYRYDMFGSGAGDKSRMVAEVIAIVITRSSAEVLITDLLVCASKQKATQVTLPRFGLKEHLFKNFLKPSASEFHGPEHCLFYNYKYPEVDDNNHCLFGHIN